MIVSIVFVNVSVWLHFIYYEKKYEKIVEEKIADLKEANDLYQTWYAETESENYMLQKDITLLREEINRLVNEKLDFPVPEPPKSIK